MDEKLSESLRNTDRNGGAPHVSPWSFIDLHPFRDFKDVAVDHHFSKAPDDWTVLVADVVNSTKLIESGRYRDVNTAGGSCLAALMNICGYDHIPFVFGGDGASALVPESYREQVLQSWLGVAHMVRTGFDIDMRIGAVPVSELRKRGADLTIAKMELSPGNSIAMFSGGGMMLADKVIKEDPTFQHAKPEEPDLPDLTGLSCRWEPIPARNGDIVSLMVEALGTKESRVKIYEKILILLDTYASAHGRLNPVSMTGLELASLRAPLGWEGLLTGKTGWNRIKGHMKVVMERILQAVSHRCSLSMGDYHPDSYLEELIVNSDYRKFDDMLRMVIDLSPDQQKELEHFLKEMEDRGEVRFGLHKANHAIMTCFVETLSPSSHIHFIDGADGGYAMAAQMMKKKASR